MSCSNSREVRKGRLVGVTRMGEKMVFWRDTEGKPGCVVDLCPHRGVALSTGKLLGDCIQCPFHGFEFDITGRCTVIPANGRSAEVPRVFKVKSYLLRELHGFIYLWWGEPRGCNTLPCPILIICANQKLVYSTATDVWNVHYLCVIENQLDEMDHPFIHSTTIGRGNKTVVQGPRYEVEQLPGRGWHAQHLDQ